MIDSGQYMLGPEVTKIEKSFAERLGVAGAVGVASGTAALELALLALGVGRGDEVITVSHTAGPTVAAICMTGATPVLVDIDPTTYGLDAVALDGAIGPRTKAILPVHLYGHPADIGSIVSQARQRNVAVIEDCAQAQEASVDGRPVGSFGDAGCFSFYPTKILGALGDGGLVSAASSELVDRLRQLRTYGWKQPQLAEVPGGRCARLDELQAAILNVKLGHLQESIARRRAIAKHYCDAFSGLPIVCPEQRPGCIHVYSLFVIRCDRRDALAEHLMRAGVATGLHYPYAIHRQPVFADCARIPQPLAVTEKIAGEILSLPLYPSLTEEDQARVIAGVRSFFGPA